MTSSIIAEPRETILNLLPRAAVGIEIGVWRGDFSARMLRTAKPTTLHLVDPWREATAAEYADAWYSSAKAPQTSLDEIHKAVNRRFAGQIAAGQIQIHRKPSAEALSTFRDNSIDFVYVDGDHAYEGVLADLCGAFRVVKPGGLICGDDYSLGKWWKDGVVRAFHEFLASHTVRIELLLGAQFAVRKLRPEPDE